jgi:AcrR family transcriptional regulator
MGTKIVPLPARPARRGRPAGADSDSTRERILAAARECFSNYGFEAATNQLIAQGAGITHGTIYHYFSSKEELFLSVQEQVSREVLDQFKHATSGDHPTLLDRLTALVDGVITMYTEDPTVARFALVWSLEARKRHDHPDWNFESWQETLDFYNTLVNQAKAAHEVLADVDGDALAHAIRTVLFGLAALMTNHNDPVMLRAAADVLVRGWAGELFTPQGAARN